MSSVFVALCSVATLVTDCRTIATMLMHRWVIVMMSIFTRVFSSINTSLATFKAHLETHLSRLDFPLWNTNVFCLYALNCVLIYIYIYLGLCFHTIYLLCLKGTTKSINKIFHISLHCMIHFVTSYIYVLYNFLMYFFSGKICFLSNCIMNFKYIRNFTAS